MQNNEGGVLALMVSTGFHVEPSVCDRSASRSEADSVYGLFNF